VGGAIQPAQAVEALHTDWATGNSVAWAAQREDSSLDPSLSSGILRREDDTRGPANVTAVFGACASRSAAFQRKETGVTEGHDVSPRPTLHPCASWMRVIAVCSLGLGLLGCGSLNPAFVDLVDPSGTAGLSTLSNPPGHVVITVINNAEVDERLLSFLESTEGGNLQLTEAEKRALRPRIRMRVRLTHDDPNETVSLIEFVTGSGNLIDQNFSAQGFPDLNQNELDNIVVLCDVQSVELEPGSNIDVFVPVEVTGYELIEATNQAGTVIGVTFEARERRPPGFLPLRVDVTDADDNVEVFRNIGIRDVPSPVGDPRCGSVIAIVVDGVLSVPFFDGATPSFDREDEATEALIGGRYEFRVSVQ